ncbi:hypothetical protein [Planococcus versutus]|uniref:Uncharacterized protein n=1 Tax=Planococcus versutus TaxID=1302659 RepID=A0A1B1S5G5_9BACL|nr:hypothetical protein [Planococcus versutus]ANU28423.1 hypothetical protein I858_015645 [Planococcus versutus]
MKQSNFRPQDQRAAEKEHWRIEGSLNAIEELLEVGEYEVAARRAEEILRSTKEIERLAKAKKEWDGLGRLLEDLKKTGIHFERMTRHDGIW